ncbi:MAG: bifunctional DNA primase/polymerase [Solirubrobacteraceae bacterium]
MTRLGRAAAELAAIGYPVHPLRARAKVPATRNGFKDATRDTRQIERWWDAMPDANIGIACGASGIVVLDIDTKAGADPREILARFDRAGAPVIGTGLAPERCERYPRSLAGRRGAQVYFRGNMPSATRLTVAGCEVKAAGGYVVGPPSVHPCGAEYVGQLPPVAELPPIPGWLSELVPRPESRSVATIPVGRTADPCRVLAGLARVVREAPIGERNHRCFWASCRIAEHAATGTLEEREAVEEIRAAAIAAGLSEHEAERTIRSGLNAGARAAA